MGTHLHRGDHAQRALGSDEDLVQVRPDRLARLTAGGDDRAVGEHDFESHDDVLDLAVAGRVLPGAPTGRPTADGRQRHGLWPVSDGQTMLAAQLRLEVIAEGAGRRSHGQRVVIDIEDAAQPAQVEYYAAMQRDRVAAHPGSSGGHGQRDRLGVADGDDGADLNDRGRRNDDGRPLANLALECPGHRQWPPVTARLGGICRVDAHVGAGGPELGQLCIGHLGAF